MCDDAALEKTLGFYLKSRPFLPSLLLELYFIGVRNMIQLKLICPVPDGKSKKGTALDAVSLYAFWLLQL